MEPASISLESRVLRQVRLAWPQSSATASISLESRVLRRGIECSWGNNFDPPQSLWNHGCCDASIGQAATAFRPPQSLWNHGCCDAACGGTYHRPQSASISLESRVLRPIGGNVRGPQSVPPQSLWNHGCCDDFSLASFVISMAASISLESRVLRRLATPRLNLPRPRLNLFGITGAATVSAYWRRTR